MLKRSLLIGLLCVSLLVVVSCGSAKGGGTDGGSMPAQDPTTPAPTPEPSPEPDTAAPDDDDGDVSILPFPVDDEIERDDLVIPFQPVDDDRHNWDLSGDDPMEVAKQFALRGWDDCDCNEMTAVIFEETPESTTVEVLMAGVRDDSLRNYRYRVTLVREDGAWTVSSAEREITCRRGVTNDGLCV